MSRLTCFNFRLKDIDLFSGFSCGNEVYEKEVAAWIQDDGDECVTRAIKSDKTEVWYYKEPAGRIVGYSSLAPVIWTLHTPAKKAVPVTVSVLPALAIGSDFQGQPPGDDRPNRYWAQIMRDVIGKASRRQGRAPLLGLFVHPENAKARRCYELCGFEDYDEVEYSLYTDKNYKSMILGTSIKTDYTKRDGSLLMPSRP